MSDSRFNSVYFEGLTQRREEFRVARDRLESACGEETLYGEPGGTLSSHELPRPVMPRFCIRDGEVAYPLLLGVNSVGRMLDNTIVLCDEHVSRKHFAIVVHHDGKCEIHDVASKNGTIVNGRRITQPTHLHLGDQIRVCKRTLVFDTQGQVA